MSWGRRGRLAWRGVGALALAVAGSTEPAATHAGAQASSQPTVELNVGHAGQFEPGSPVVARVRIRTPRLFAGDLVLSSNRVEVTREVEVAGGSVKEFYLLVPTSSFERSLEVQAFLRKGDRVVTSVSDGADFDASEEPVGLLPGAAGSGELPGVVPLTVDIGTARFSRVAMAELDLAPDSLASLGTIAAASGEVGALSPEQRSALLQWVHLGGRLLVDEAPGTATAGLYDTSGDGRASAGNGEIVAVDGAIAAGRWTGLIEPTERWSSQERGDSGMITDLVAQDANIRQAGLGGLSVFLLLYVFLVGPVMFLVLRQSGRRQWAWAGIPGIALVFTIGAYVLGRDLRSNARPAHASILISSPAGSLAKSWVGVNSTRGGTAKIRFPREWSAQSSMFNGNGSRAGRDKLNDQADGLEARIPLGPGEFGLLEAQGPVRQPGGLEIVAAPATDKDTGEGTISGTIKNTLPFAVEGVYVAVGSTAHSIGNIPAGQTADWVAPAPVVAFGNQSIADQIAATSFDGSRFDRANFGRRALVSEAQRALGWTDAAGTVSAYGWTSEYSPPVAAGGTRQIRGTTLVVGLAAIPGGFPGGGDVRLLRGSMFEGQGVMGGGRNGESVVLRIDAAKTVNPANALLDAPTGNQPAEVWIDGRWHSLGQGVARPADEQPGGFAEAAPEKMITCSPDGGCSTVVQGFRRGALGVGGTSTAPIPAGAFVNGRVFVRLAGIVQPFAIGQVRVR